MSEERVNTFIHRRVICRIRKRERPENTETQQVEKSIHSIDNAYRPDSPLALNFQNPNFDLVLARLILQIKENQPSILKSTDDQIEALKSTSDQIAELERAVELVLAAESDTNTDLESAGDSTDQMVALESPVESSASRDSAELEPPEPSRMNLLYNLVRQHCPAFTDANRMRDEYGITTIRDEILLESHHKLLFLLHEHRRQNGHDALETLLSRALIREVKYLYSLSLIQNVVLEEGGSDFPPLFPPPGEEGRLFCAALILGYTLIAFAEYTCTDKVRKVKQIESRCLTAGIPLFDLTGPLHPLIRWFEIVKESYLEIKQYSDTMKRSLVHFFTTYVESINRELDRLATK